jgi:hypothetical protein
MASTPQQVRTSYRILARLIERMPQHKSTQEKAWKELRENFRKPLAETETMEDRLKKANDRIGFLRITTPKGRNEKRAGTYVYKDGKLVEEGQVTRIDSNGRVVSNWDGKNLDPCAVKRHNVGLKRAGFVNNLHAKGIF